MRTIPFREVYEGVLRLRGFDPDVEIPPDTQRAVVQHINKRVRTAWRRWPWPELDRTEERVFTVIWNATKRFYRVGLNGKPDELFYIPNMKYYKVLAVTLSDTDPPAGTLPTNTSYFEELITLDTFIPVDQTCQYPIGLVHGIYQTNPRTFDCCNGSRLNFTPSEKGIDVFNAGGPSVFVRYQIAHSKFTAIPYAPGRTYKLGDLRYDGNTGECYKAMVDNVGEPITNTEVWAVVPFPEFMSEYVKVGAKADSLRESDPKIEVDAAAMQMRLAYANAAELEAEELITREIDRYLEQGQRFFYRPLRLPNYYPYSYCYGKVMATPDWTPTEVVTTLSDICVDHTDAPVEPIPTGLFVLTGGPIMQNTLYNDDGSPRLDVVGVSVAQAWSLIEPTEGDFNWGPAVGGIDYDREIGRAADAGKLILTGAKTGGGPESGGGALPNWVNAGLPSDQLFSFINTRPNGAQETIQIPLFWNQTFLDKKKNMYAALGAHFSDNPAVKIVRVNAFNSQTEDFNIHGGTVIDGLPPTNSTETSRWLAAGWTHAKMVGAGAQIIDAAMEAFPRQWIIITIGPVNSVALQKVGGDAWSLARDVIDAARLKWGGRFVVGYNQITCKLSLSFAQTYAGIPLATQILWFAFQDPKFKLVQEGGLNPEGLTDDQILRRAMDNAVGGSWLEIFERDSRNLPDAITYGHNLLHKE